MQTVIAACPVRVVSAEVIRTLHRDAIKAFEVIVATLKRKVQRAAFWIKNHADLVPTILLVLDIKVLQVLLLFYSKPNLN